MREDWTDVELGEVCFTTSGGTPSRRKDEFYNGSIPWVKSGELDKGIIYDTEEKISEDAIRNSSAKIFPKGTLLIALYGATIGKLAFLGVDASTNQAICGIFKSEALDSKYLYNFLLFSRYHLVSQGSGGAQPNISQTILKKLLIPIPPLPIQRVIVTKIENLFASLDKGIADLEKAQEQLKVYRQAVLKKAFEGGLTNQNIKNGELPKGWEKLTLGDIANRNSQKALPHEMPNAKFIGMDCIEANTLKPFKFYDFGEFKSAGNIFKINQVLYGRMRPYLNKVYRAEVDGTCSGEFIVLDCKDGFNPDLLKYILHHRDFVSFANHKTSGDRPRISFEEIADYPVNVCKPEEQNQIVREIESRLSVCDKVEQSICESLEKSKALRQSILRNAFEGKLLSEEEIAKCKQAADYEPASALLKKVKTIKGK